MFVTMVADGSVMRRNVQRKKKQEWTAYFMVIWYGVRLSTISKPDIIIQFSYEISHKETERHSYSINLYSAVRSFIQHALKKPVPKSDKNTTKDGCFLDSSAV
jgi:hypothetical protein